MKHPPDETPRLPHGKRLISLQRIVHQKRLVALIRRIWHPVILGANDGAGAIAFIEFQPAAVDPQQFGMAKLFLLVGPRIEEHALRTLGDEEFARRLVQCAADPPRPPLRMARDVVKIAEANIREIQAERKSEDLAPAVFRHQQDPGEILGDAALRQFAHPVQNGDLFGERQLEHVDDFIKPAPVRGRAEVEYTPETYHPAPSGRCRII